MNLKSFLMYLAFPVIGLLSLQTICVSTAFAQNRQVYQVNQTLGDGKSGRVWKNWTQNIPQGTVAKVTAEVRRTNGGGNTFVNLRYGRGGAFENGKQIQLGDDKFRVVHWNVGQAANGQPLVMNAYNGEVELRKVIVDFQGANAATQASNNYSKRNSGRRGGGVRGDYRNNDQRFNNQPRNGEVARNCRQGNFRAPRIEIDKFKPSGGLFSGKYRVTGSVFGACVEEAGYFENGKLIERFEVPYTDRFQRAAFNFRAKTGERGEIRVFSSDGSEDSIYIDDLARNNNQGNQQGGQPAGNLLDGLLN